ncbi:MAG: aldehyde dehydrogenase family protein, partial [Haloechinothrix sp.]
MADLMEPSGTNLIGGRQSARGEATFTAVDPRTGRPLEVQFHEATEEEVAEATRTAADAFRELRAWPTRRLAALLGAMADRLDQAGDVIVEQADRETALGVSPRLEGELARTTGQIRAFARLLDGG